MKQQQKIALIAASSLMLILIFDSKTAILAAQEGLELCLKTIIPSLFPMIFLSAIITRNLIKSGALVCKPIEGFLGLPRGGLGIYLSGLLGGYPIGAKCLSDSYQSGAISKKKALHLLQFISNTGPSFVFGICGLMFSSAGTVWSIWLVQILSSILTGVLVKDEATQMEDHAAEISYPENNILSSSLRAMAGICAWVIIFRVMLEFVRRWVLWYFPSVIQVLVSGFFELTNGSCMLMRIPDESIRYVVCCTLLSFGGLCVMMQTKSVISGLSIMPYIKGKAIQTVISFSISILISTIQYPNLYYSDNQIWSAISGITLIILFSWKLGIAFFRKMFYNLSINQKKRYGYAVSEKN